MFIQPTNIKQVFWCKLTRFADDDCDDKATKNNVGWGNCEPTIALKIVLCWK